ncbi:MAG TPA: DEAD/DEAH box helicase [Nevskiaceae bacterium]|nr:DEAD/DEAH box helicase [Nevskiaceae bacterium]
MDTSDLRARLRQQRWQRLFTSQTLDRARGYLGQARVLSLRHDSDEGTETLHGLVQGSRNKPYACTIDLQVSDRALSIQTDCQCPMTYHCKHAAALLMMATDLPAPEWPTCPERGAPTVRIATPPDSVAMTAIPGPGTALGPWSYWFDRLATPMTSDPAAVAQPEREFGLLLHVGPARRHTATLQMRPVWLRPSRTKSGTYAGRLVDPQGLQLTHHGPVPAPAQGWPPSVAAALTILLRGRPEGFSNQWLEIATDYEEDAFRALLEHYPLYLERGNAPLSRAEALPLHLVWTALVDGSQRLDAEVQADEPARLLQGATFWYLAPKARQFGAVAADPHLIDSLAHAPTLLPEQVPAVRRRLAHTKSASSLPLPAERTTPQRLAVAPRAVLELHLLSTSFGYTRTASLPGFARLSYDYGGMRVTNRDGASLVRRFKDGQVLDIQRDSSAEIQISRTLHQLGFEPAGWRSVSLHGPDGQLQPDDLLLNPDGRHRSLAADEWQPTIEKLQVAGLRIQYCDGFPHHEEVRIDAWHAQVTPEGNAWFDVSLGVDIGSERVDLLPVLRQLIADPGFPRRPAKREKPGATWPVQLDATRSVALPLAQLRTLIEPLLEWLESDGEAAPRLHRSQLLELDGSGLAWHGGEDLRRQLEALRAHQLPAQAPAALQARLRPYQLTGLAWLNFLADAGLGGILADDMGLGKTVQVLAHLLVEQQRGRLKLPALVVVPTSLVGNWQAEAARFAPTLKVLVLHGPERAKHFAAIAEHHLVITTYPLLPRDIDVLKEHAFSLLVLDEAQTIKNVASQAAHAVRKLHAERRLAMTGTPLENHLGELWAQFDAVEPGLLGTQRHFGRFYRTPIEKHSDVERLERLQRRVGPLLLRRRKDDVLADLPPKTEIIHAVELEADQRGLYETLRLAQNERVREAIAQRGLAQSGIVVLDALLKLRQACCDPRLVKLASASKVKTNAKLTALLELLSSLLSDGRRVLLFSQFTEMLNLIALALTERGVDYQTLTGQTPARERTSLVKHFQAGNVPLFLISLKAGGVGLNLTAADTVIHYDPWWNPAVEAQATDRAHRIGQHKPVFVYRLICTGTVEEKIRELQARKAGLARAVLEGGGASRALRFDAADLDALFGPA